MNEKNDATTKIYGIYSIRNIINNKKYIGKSSNVYKRWKQHIYNSNTKNPPCHIHRAIKHYGLENFEFQVEFLLDSDCEFKKLQTVEEKDRYMSLLENYVIITFKTYNPAFGYNATYGGEGVACTSETKNKISIAQKKRLKDKRNHPYFNKPGAFLGRKHTEEAKKAISENNKGKRKNLTEQQKKTVSEKRKIFNTGRKWYYNIKTGQEKFLSQQDDIPEDFSIGRAPFNSNCLEALKIKGKENNNNAKKVFCLETKEIFNSIRMVLNKFNCYDDTSIYLKLLKSIKRKEDFYLDGNHYFISDISHKENEFQEDQ